MASTGRSRRAEGPGGRGRAGRSEAAPARRRGHGRQGHGIERVRKRDGREVPFAGEKIQAAIQAAMEATGEPDPGFAGEVAQVVELTLEQRLADEQESAEGGASRPLRAPHIEEIQDLVEKALMELGRPAVAKAYILYRDQRARIREALRVHPSSEGPGVTRPRVREAEGVAEWSKGKIVAALMAEAELPRATAEEVAAAVERRIFASRLRRVTTGLVRELVSGELFERGLTRAIARQARIGLARGDVRAALRGRPLHPWTGAGTEQVPERREAARQLGEELLRRHVLDEVLGEGVAELHHAGDLHFEGLGRAHLPLALSLEADLLAPGGAAPAHAYELLEAVADLAGELARTLVLERPAEVLQPLAASRRLGRTSALAAWLGALGSVARAAGVRVELGSSGVERADFSAALLAELAELAPGPATPGLILEARELEEVLGVDPALADAAERLLAEDRLAISWSDGDERLVAPGCRRRPGERGVLACTGAVALDLARLARRAGPHREELVQRGLAELVQASLEGARALERFRASAVPPRARGLRMRPSFALVPVRLREALVLLGDGTIDPDQGARLLGLLAEAAGRFAHDGPQLGAGLGLVAPSAYFGEEAAARFAWLERTAAAGDERQTWLFAEAGDADARDAGAVGGRGLALSPVPGLPSGAAEARLLRTLSAGVHRRLGAGALEADRAAGATPELDAWRRFESSRRRDRGERSLELFPAPPTPQPSAATPPNDSAPRRPTLRPLT